MAQAAEALVEETAALVAQASAVGPEVEEMAGEVASQAVGPGVGAQAGLAESLVRREPG